MSRMLYYLGPTLEAHATHIDQRWPHTAAYTGTRMGGPSPYGQDVPPSTRPLQPVDIMERAHAFV